MAKLTWGEVLKEQAEYKIDVDAFCKAKQREIDASIVQAIRAAAIYGTGVYGASYQAHEPIYKLTCTAVDRNKGEITYTVSKLDDIVNFELGQQATVDLDVIKPNEGSGRWYHTGEESEAGKIYEFKQGTQWPATYYQGIGNTGTVSVDDGPQSYDGLLDACAQWDCEEFTEDNLDDIETCHEAGDETLARLLREAEEADARVAVHARAMQAARKAETLASPEAYQGTGRFSVEGLTGWLASENFTNLPPGLKIQARRAMEDGFEVHAQLGEHYGAVFLGRMSYEAATHKVLYWADRREEVLGLVRTLEARQRPGVMIKADAGLAGVCEHGRPFLGLCEACNQQTAQLAADIGKTTVQRLDEHMKMLWGPSYEVKRLTHSDVQLKPAVAERTCSTCSKTSIPVRVWEEALARDAAAEALTLEQAKKWLDQPADTWADTASTDLAEMVKAEPERYTYQAKRIAEQYTSLQEAAIRAEQSAGEQFRSLMGPGLNATDLLASEPKRPAVSERVCQTCSKTCDVDIPCWWCGNA